MRANQREKSTWRPKKATGPSTRRDQEGSPCASSPRSNENLAAASGCYGPCKAVRVDRGRSVNKTLLQEQKGRLGRRRADPTQTNRRKSRPSWPLAIALRAF